MRLILLLVTVLLMHTNIHAQEKVLTPRVLHKNYVYVYLGTSVACYSTGINFERNVMKLPRSNLNLRVGAGLYAFLWGDSGLYYVANICHILGPYNNHFEYNLGYALYTATYSKSIKNYPSAYVGYRYEKKNGKLIFRTGFGWPEQLSVSFGVGF